MNKIPKQAETNGDTNRLPHPWDVAVQLIGTFGLAVFLVLYYLFVMKPQETAKYEQLRFSVDSLTSVLQSQQTLITREQEFGIENLYINAVTLDISNRIMEGIRRNQSEEDIRREIENVLINKTRFVQGFARRDGRILSERFTNRIRESQIADMLAREAVHGWRTKDHEEITERCFAIIDRNLFRR